MKYTLEDISQVKKSIQVTVPAKDVDAQINFMIKDLGKDLKMAGFRPGKVPATVVEKRFRKEIYHEATQRLVNMKLAEIVKELNFTPVSRIDFDGADKVVKGEDFSYKVTFEILPDIKLPEYSGLKVEEEVAAIDDAEIDATIERIRQNLGELKPLEVSRAPEDGEVAFVDFSAQDEDGNPVESFKGTGYQILLGSGQIQDDFEAIIKKLAPGESGEGTVKVAKDAADLRLAGKKLKVKATVQSLAQRILPEVDDKLAAQLGVESVAKMRESIKAAHEENLRQQGREAAQQKMLNELLDKVEFELPQSLVDAHVDATMADFKANMQRLGREDPKNWDMPEADVEKKTREEASHFIKSQMFLLRVAEKEKLEVTNQEIEQQIYAMASRSGVDPKALREYYIKNDMIYSLEDRLKCSKALAFIYDKAEVKEVPAKKAKAAAASSEEKPKKAKASPKKAE